MLLTTLLWASLAVPQAAQPASLWQQVPLLPHSPHAPPLSLSSLQADSIEHAIAARVQQDGSCSREEAPDLVQHLEFGPVLLAADRTMILVVAGQGCARGAQGANGAMWLVRMQASHVVFLATPQQHFSGWLYSVQPTASHGLRDLVVAWHMGAAETDLSYFRFNGKSYIRIAGAKEVSDPTTPTHIVPTTEPSPAP